MGRQWHGRHHRRRWVGVAIWMHIRWWRHTIRKHSWWWHMMRHNWHGWIHIGRVIRWRCVRMRSILVLSPIIIFFMIINFVTSVNFFFFLFSIIPILFFLSIILSTVMVMSTWFMTWFMTLLLWFGRVPILYGILSVLYRIKFDIWVCRVMWSWLLIGDGCCVVWLGVVGVRRVIDMWIGGLKVRIIGVG